MQLNLGIDIGFGDVKVIAKGDGSLLRYKFPSAIKADTMRGLGLSIVDENMDITEKYALLLNGQQIFIGNGIMGKIGSSQSIGTEKSKKDYLILTAATLGMIAADYEVDNVDVALTLGFPLKSSKDFKRRIVNDILSLAEVTLQNMITNRNKTIRINVQHVYSLSQGIGAFISELGLAISDGYDTVRSESAHYLKESTLIIDIGNNVINSLYVAPGFKVNEDFSRAYYQVGVVQAIDMIQSELQERGLPLDRRTVQEDILKMNPVEYEGITDIRDIRNEAIKNAWERYTGKTIEDIITKISIKNVKPPKTIVFYGGGTILFKSFIKERFIPKFNHIISNNPVFANAKGFYIWTKYKKELNKIKNQ